MTGRAVRNGAVGKDESEVLAAAGGSPSVCSGAARFKPVVRPTPTSLWKAGPWVFRAVSQVNQSGIQGRRASDSVSTPVETETSLGSNRQVCPASASQEGCPGVAGRRRSGGL